MAQWILAISCQVPTHLKVLEEELSSSPHSCAVTAGDQHTHDNQCIYTPAAIAIGKLSISVLQGLL